MDADEHGIRQQKYALHNLDDYGKQPKTIEALGF